MNLVASLQPGGSTHGSAGIQTAYEVAHRSHRDDGVTRVILCTDGDFNVGLTDQHELTRLIKDEAKRGVYLTVLGFGMGNYKDSTLELLADNGNGNYAYIDTPHEAHKVLVEELSATLVTIAKDVKIQVEFNPRHVGSYRLIGYENRMLETEDFDDDRKDAGEVGAGHNITALYELTPPSPHWRQELDLRYQDTDAPESIQNPWDDELMRVQVRYKPPTSSRSLLMSQTVPLRTGTDRSDDLRFAAAVAAFGMILRDSPHAGSASFDMVMNLAEEGAQDPYGHRQEFLELVRVADQTVAMGW
jgi:Ca-activated chloride channel family protein